MSNFLSKFLRERANDAVNGVDEPFRSGLNELLDSTGLGDSARSFNNNTFSGLIQERVAQSASEADQLARTRTIATTETDPALNKNYDWRARLRPKEGGKALFYGVPADIESNSDYLMRPIQQSNGLVWQYTPTVYMSAAASYNSSDFQGQNYAINTYNNSMVAEITVNAPFTANNIYEARYLLAVMTFMRIATKSYYGDQAGNLAGTPPPVMLFEYLGDHGFNKVPVIVTNYTITLPDNVDYVPVKVGRGDGNDATVTYVPTETEVMVTLKPQYTPHKLRTNFNLTGIANGSLYKDGYV